ncbi:DUF3558 domain-containing protein [Lentzea flava]|uniref:DUF3558 domain-containing protein n=1 Tax=Lentzea flava TaxID=103732 RepID=A0ABQ2UVA4_9PSEU|nr:DUF3558 domain-containing protein [Lentzea flava]MCP2201590.1 Protein of unknown function (DUF3558) [Lentzea flava]GGU53461.1 hypothetical protein GCM10010178_52950 [Lentzea flava]
MKRILIATLIGLSALTAACTGTTGNPTPAPTTGGGTPTSDSNASSRLKSIKPCDLLTGSDATGLGLELPGEAEKVATSDGCSWKVTGNGRLRAGIRTESGIKDLNLQGDKVSEIKVGKYDATKVEAPDGAKSQCTIVIGVTEKSSVAVIATLNLSSEDTAAACQRASKAADLIAPKLP